MQILILWLFGALKILCLPRRYVLIWWVLGTNDKTDLERLLTYAERRFLHWHHPYPCAGSPSESSTHFQVLCDHRQLCACYRKIRVNLAKKVKQASRDGKENLLEKKSISLFLMFL